jgi:hypothetical protein
VSLARRSIASDRARASGSDGDDGDDDDDDDDDGTAARASPRRVRARDDVDAR